MVSPLEGNLADGTPPSLEAKPSPFPEPQQVAGRSSHTPCPHCASRMVRARDRRDMCLICGYLQSHT
jgi:hypothetical protein